MAKKQNTNKIEIPPHVKANGEEAIKMYKQFIALQEGLRSHPKRWYSIPDSNEPERIIKIDLIQAYPVVHRKIKHISQEEREKIREVWGELMKIKSKMAQLSRKAQAPKGGEHSLENLDPYASEMLELFGQWKTSEEVKKYLFDKHGYNVPLPKISRFRMANRDKIDQLKTEWDQKYDDFDVARKRGRIERLAFIVRTQMDKYKDNNYNVKHSQELRAALEQIRKEVEGDKLKIDFEGQLDVNATINMNLTVQNLTRKISINNFVVALVAAKRGIDPLKLMHLLSHSYYKDYNGYMKRGTLYDKQTNYPSNLIQQYDWDEIESKHANNNVEDVEDIYVEPEELESKPEDIRSKMLDILKNKQSVINELKK